MEKRKQSRGICTIRCTSGTETFRDMTRKECMERASVSGCAPSWTSCDGGTVCHP